MSNSVWAIHTVVPGYISLEGVMPTIEAAREMLQEPNRVAVEFEVGKDYTPINVFRMMTSDRLEPFTQDFSA